MNHFILLLSCNDQPGIVHQLTGLLVDLGANIVHADQHSTNLNNGQFFIRLEFVVSANLSDIESTLADLKQTLNADIYLYDRYQPLPCSIFVSKEDHCLQELLYQWASGELNIDIQSIVSNHDDYQDLADWYKVPFHYVNYDSKEAAEKQLLSLTESTSVIIMARFMQILSNDFLTAFQRPVINIHHSFLPSFKGAKPYHQAFERGVKLIGATAHFASPDLDEGPIITQHVQPVTHRDHVDDLKALGRRLEKQTLVEAVQKMAEHRVIIDQHKTIVF